MKETRFIAQNKEKWRESEKLLKDSFKDPEKVSNLFTQVVDDLSYSRTYYRNRSVRVYLNNIAREYFSLIYYRKKEKKNRFRLFWLDELPQIVLFSRRQLLLSLFVFLLSLAIGVFSSIKDPQFASTILGNGYVAMTKENIKKGDPMAVYKSGHQVNMMLGITINNLMVAFRTYVFGIFLSVGTLAILLYNGIMVGCFQFFFIERGLFAESALSIWLHGTLEISSIIIAGGAGLVLGSGLLFPGTYSRLQAFQISATRSLKLMLGITPIILLAAIIESFLTRYTEVPDIFKLLLILLSAAFIVGYFVIYPWRKSKSGFEEPLKEVRLVPATSEPIQFDRIKNTAELVRDAFLFFKKNANPMLSLISVVSLLMTLANLFLVERETQVRAALSGWKYYVGDLFFALDSSQPVLVGINVLATSIILHRVFLLIDSDQRGSEQRPFLRWPLVQTALTMSAFYGMLYWLGVWGSVMALFMFALFLLIASLQVFNHLILPSAIARAWNLVNPQQVFGLQFVLLLLAYSFVLFLSAPLLYLLTYLEWNVARTDVWMKGVRDFLEAFIRIFSFNMVIPLFGASAAYLSFSLQETFSASHLKEAIAHLGTRMSKSSPR